MRGVCNCVGGPPPFGVCNGCGALGPGAMSPYPTRAPSQPGWVCSACGGGNAPCIAEGTRGDWGQVPISAGLMFMTPFLYRVMVS